MVAFSHLAFPLVLAALASAASYYPPFLTPTSADEWSNAFGYGYIVSWNQTLPDGVNATDAATSATIGLGISSGDWGYYGESGFLYDAAVPCRKSRFSVIKDLFTGPGFVNVSIGGGFGKAIIGWEEWDTAKGVQSEEFTIISGTDLEDC